MDLALQGLPPIPDRTSGKGNRTFFPALLLFSLLLFVYPAVWAGPGADNTNTPGMLCDNARAAFYTGDTGNALAALNTLRTLYPDWELTGDALLLSARIYLSAGEGYKARFYLKKLMAEADNQELAVEAAVLLADIYYQERIFDEALIYYQTGLKLAGKPGKGSALPHERIYLRLAELTYYQVKDYNLARNYFKQIKIPFTAKEELAAYDLLKRRLAWESITPEAIGAGDGNISAIAVDGDDLWIGTWNGGVARYSYSTGKIRLFKEGVNSITDNSILAIAVEKKRIWVGTYNGLAFYSKTDSSWHTIEKFGKVHPGKISVIKNIGDEVYAGTLGNGLWKYGKNSWKRVGDEKIPGNYILCLEEVGNELYLGTMTQGICILDRNRGTFKNLDQVVPEFTPRNITMLLADNAGRLWIGTYGSGLVLWDKRTSALAYYSKKSGEIGDDWVLCGISSAQGIYFGTFGGGAAFFAFKDESWHTLGIAEGLTSRDVAALACSGPVVYFGTLGAGIAVYREVF